MLFRSACWRSCTAHAPADTLARGQELWLQPLRRALRRLPPGRRALVTTMIAGVPPSRSIRHQRGQHGSPTCDCGEEDTLLHRLYWCELTKFSWGRLEAEILRRARTESAAGSVMFLRGWSPRLRHRAGAGRLVHFEGLNVWTGGPGPTLEEGRAFADGSCQDQRLQASTAGFGLVQLREGLPYRGTLGTVPWPHQNTRGQPALVLHRPPWCPTASRSVPWRSGGSAGRSGTDDRSQPSGATARLLSR